MNPALLNHPSKIKMMMDDGWLNHQAESLAMLLGEDVIRMFSMVSSPLMLSFTDIHPPQTRSFPGRFLGGVYYPQVMQQKQIIICLAICLNVSHIGSMGLVYSPTFTNIYQ